MWCTYNKGNGKKCSIWWYHNSQTRICQSLFWNMICTYRTSGYQQCPHLHPLELLLWLNHVLLTLFFRNMALAGHTHNILKFWLQILNLLEIWAQMIYGSSHMGSLLVNLIVGLDHHNGCIKGYRPDMKIPSSDPESAHQIGPNDIWFMSFRGGNLTLSWCSKFIYVWHGLQFSYKDFVCRLWISSEIKSRYKSNHPKRSWSYFLILCNYHWSSHIRCYNGNFKFPCSYSESPQKTSPDTSQTIPNGAGHISRFSWI